MASKFEAYLQYVCAGIRSSQKRADIHDELLGHLEENYERARATGRTEQEAENDAMKSMGDRNMLRYKFAQLYKFSPPEYMRSTANCIIFGLLFIFLRADIVPYSTRLFPLVGQILLVCALFRLYHFHKAFKVAAGIFTAYLFCANAAWFVIVYDMPQSTWRTVFAMASMVFFNLFCAALYIGMQSICDKYSTKNSAIAFCILPQFWVAYVTVIVPWAGDTPAPLDELSSLNLEILFGLSFPLVALWHAKQALSYTESQIPLDEPISRKKRKLLAVCMVLCLFMPFASMFAAATRAPKTESYTVADTYCPTEADKARAHLRTLELPEKILQDLPDSEVLHYRTAQYMESEPVYHSFGEFSELTAYIFYLNGLPKEEITNPYAEKAKYLRVLIVGEGFDEKTVRFRDGIYATYQDDHLLHGFEWSDADFFLLLAEKDGVTVSAQPFSSWHDTHRPAATGFSGYDFTFPHHTENRRMYFASTASVCKIDYILTSWTFQYYRQVLPLNIVYRCNHERIDDAGTNTYHPWDYEVKTYSAWVSLDITPEKFTGKTA